MSNNYKLITIEVAHDNFINRGILSPSGVVCSNCKYMQTQVTLQKGATMTCCHPSHIQETRVDYVRGISYHNVYPCEKFNSNGTCKLYKNKNRTLPLTTGKASGV